MDSVLERIQRLQQTCQQVVAEVILLSYELRHLKETEALKRELESAVIPPEKKQDRKLSPPRAAASSYATNRTGKRFAYPVNPPYVDFQKRCNT